MSILPAEVREDRLRELCAQRCPESQTLEFKHALPGLNDKAKSEFLKDVCAFANSDGGDLVYGIAEEKGEATDVLPITEESADATRRRLGQILDAGLEPRLVGLRIQDVPIAGGGYVLILRVPASFGGPHRYTVNNVGRFVMRNGTHTVELTYDQLRSAFDRTATLAERARRFREDRLKAINAGRGGRPLVEGPICVVHLVPIASMAGNRSVDIQALYNNFMPYIFSDWGGASRSTNLDGLVVYSAGRTGERSAAFTQIFRSGALEAVRTVGGTVDRDRKIIPSTGISRFVRTGIEKFLRESRSLGFAGPAIVGVAVLSVGEYEFAVGPKWFPPDSARADRENLILPETWLEDIAMVSEVDQVARPLLDILWQGFDVEQCHLYDEQGRWQP